MMEFVFTSPLIGIISVTDDLSEGGYSFVLDALIKAYMMLTLSDKNR